MDPFRYFANPQHPLSSWAEDPQPCRFCGTKGPGFDGPYYGEEDVERVCEQCLRAGRLSDFGLSTCEPDADALEAQLRRQNPDWSESQLDALVKELTIELTQRTPGLQTWQELVWPAHCGDYCTFEEELGQPEIAELAGDVEPKVWFADNVPNAREEIWDFVRWNSAREHPTESYDFTVYCFSCRKCGGKLLRWDAN